MLTSVIVQRPLRAAFSGRQMGQHMYTAPLWRSRLMGPCNGNCNPSCQASVVMRGSAWTSWWTILITGIPAMHREQSDLSRNEIQASETPDSEMLRALSVISLPWFQSTLLTSVATCPSDVYQSATAASCQSSCTRCEWNYSPSKSSRNPSKAPTWGAVLCTVHQSSHRCAQAAFTQSLLPLNRTRGRQAGPTSSGEKLPYTDDLTRQLASPLLHSRRPTLLNDKSKPSFAWHQRKARLPFHKEARPAALLVAHHQKVGIGKLQDKTHCPHSTALLLECNPSLPRYPVTNLANAITLPQKTVPRRQRRAVWPLRAHSKGSLNALY